MNTAPKFNFQKTFGWALVVTGISCLITSPRLSMAADDPAAPSPEAVLRMLELQKSAELGDAPPAVAPAPTAPAAPPSAPGVAAPTATAAPAAVPAPVPSAPAPVAAAAPADATDALKEMAALREAELKSAGGVAAAPTVATTNKAAAPGKTAATTTTTAAAKTAVSTNKPVATVTKKPAAPTNQPFSAFVQVERRNIFDATRVSDGIRGNLLRATNAFSFTGSIILNNDAFALFSGSNTNLERAVRKGDIYLNVHRVQDIYEDHVVLVTTLLNPAGVNPPMMMVTNVLHLGTDQLRQFPGQLVWEYADGPADPYLVARTTSSLQSVRGGRRGAAPGNNPGANGLNPLQPGAAQNVNTRRAGPGGANPNLNLINGVGPGGQGGQGGRGGRGGRGGG